MSGLLKSHEILKWKQTKKKPGFWTFSEPFKMCGATVVVGTVEKNVCVVGGYQRRSGQWTVLLAGIKYPIW